MKEKKPLPYSATFPLLLERVTPLVPLTAPLAISAGRVLRKDVRADRNLPPFNRSAMDGYAVKCKEFKNGRADLLCIGTLEAGSAWDGAIRKGKCLKIMTGAPVPASADAVVKVEQSRANGDRITLTEPKMEKWLNVHRAGSDAKKGAVVLTAGETLSAAKIGTAASVGATALSVAPLLRVEVITTGGEVVAPHKTPLPSQIRDCNAPHLMARLAGLAWTRGRFAGIVKDNPASFRKQFGAALERSDVVIVTGGVSMGDFDYTHTVLEELKVKKAFHKTAIRPGKPLWFGTKGKTAVFGLPGNPVSVAVTFHEFVLPAMRKMTGFKNPLPRSVTLPLAIDVTKKNDLREFRVGRFTQNGSAVKPVAGYTGSGDFTSAGKSDGVIVLPETVHRLKAGTLVAFHPWALD